MVPSIPALQFHMIEEENEMVFNEQVMNSFNKNIYKFLNIQDISFPILVKSLINRNARNSNDSQPLFFPILGILVYGFILFIIIKIILTGVHGIKNIIQTITNHIRERIFNFLIIIGNILGFILKIILFLIAGISKLLHFTAKLILDVILALLAGIWYIIGTIITLIILIAEKLWNILGTIIGLILNILLLIYNTIFHPQSI